MNVYIFWIGDKKKISPLVNDIKRQGHKPIIGPTKEEDKILEEEYKHYADSKKLGIYAFMSDVWRFWKLRNNEGLYIDTSVKIGNGFEQWLNILKRNNKNVFFKESIDSIASCVFYSNGKDNDILYKALDTIKKFKYSGELSHVSPDVLTWVLREKIKFNYENITYTDLEIRNISDIRNPYIILKQGANSWNKKGKKNAHKWWDKAEKAYLNKKTKKTRQKFYNDVFPNFPIMRLRALYDNSKRSEFKYLKNIYRSRNFKVRWNERLIWSRIYRFFA